jgi:hypothetical protein
MWARRSYFGKAERERRWDAAHHMDAAISALNAAFIGMDATLGFHSAKRVMDTDLLLTADILEIKSTGGVESGIELGYRIVLPGFDPTMSRFEFKLLLESFGLERSGRRGPTLSEGVLAVMHHNSMRQAPGLDSYRYLLPKYQRLPTRESPVLSCRYWLGPLHGIKNATIEITFWPDKDDLTGYARLSMTEEA